MNHLGRALSAATLLLPTLLLPPTASSTDDDAWQALDRFRTTLESAGPMSARFAQSYKPFDFGSAEHEEGTLAVDLPECLRWDYDEPFPKSFLLCGNRVHYWNPGESYGEIYTLDDRDTPGLDFFLLDAATLERRYRASREENAEGRVHIRLLPHEPSEDLVEARVELDGETSRLLTLVYLDAEGSETRFDITDYRSGVDPGRFEPPPEVEWEEP